MSHVTRSIEERLDTAPLEDVFERLLEAREELAETDADALSELGYSNNLASRRRRG